MLHINEAALIAKTYGYGVTQGHGHSIFIMRPGIRCGDSVALIKPEGAGEIIPYADDYNAQDHLVASVLYREARRLYLER